MRKTVEANERAKRAYVHYLEQAKGLDEKSTDKVLSALLKFEQSTGFKPFKRFHIEQPAKFKTDLAKAKGRTGNPLSGSTIDATLALVRGFFEWLAGQQGYKSKITYSDTAYFKNSLKAARAAHAKRDKEYPSVEAAYHAFQAMPDGSDFEKRDKALFAFFMLTGARVGAVASLRLKHIDLFHGKVLQDGRDVNTKFSKTIDTTFYPVDPAYLACFTAWVEYLRHEKLFGDQDALFPKPERGFSKGGGFVNLGLSRDPYSNGSKLNAIIRNAFAMVQLPEYTPHSFRTTLAMLGKEMCNDMEQFKAWSMNMGHESMAVTVGSYMPVSRQRQAELIKGMAR
ncbi:site-specific integrase [uncultured Roseobacter sp.]|uniref:tyrosine-type recombinase/integrase n=1 Tax=uncultured Roseobacter sp. TaxID=114847 RepID=UPI00260F4141|nr:site-specific integrase [uncultured Roseobacter sp.]